MGTKTHELKRANEALRKANRDLDEFAFLASHDLREPLRMVNIYTQLLTDRYGHLFDDQARQFASRIHSSVALMERLIEETVNYSGILHADSLGSLEPVSLQDSLDQALAQYREVLDAAGASLSIGDLPCVLGEKAQLALVFENLLSNSLKYANPARTLEIQVYARRRSCDWAVHFADNGSGFPPQFAERIFGLFKRLHGREVPGTGLGLAVCRRIIERFDGEMWAEGNTETGARFTFTLKGPDWEKCDGDARGCANPAGRG